MVGYKQYLFYLEVGDLLLNKLHISFLNVVFDGKRRMVNLKSRSSLGLILSLVSFPLYADNVSYFDMTIEELMDVEITIASKSEEKSFSAASAIYVLTNEDIKRSGATTITEALKLVPGVYVSEYAGISRVSIRGFHFELTDKLLVLMDGRTVYTPLFSGVNWDEVDTYFEDISRIEVVRGPGATLWGANAVNGVINIITKNAKDTVGTSGYVLAGDYDNIQMAARHGVKISKDSYFRAYAKHFDRGNTNNKDTDTNFFDDYSSTRAGFRFDTELGNNETLKIQGDTYSNRIDFSYLYSVPHDETDETSGGNVLTKWQKKYNDKSSLTVQTYVDYTNREIYTLGDEKFTYDLEIEKQNKFEKHELVFGTGYRYVLDDLDNTDIIAGDPESRETDLVNFFFQDKYELVKGRFYITYGSKFSHNDYTHFEQQPSVRLSYLPNQDNTIWTSVSKAVRTPNRKENDPEILFGYASTSNLNIESEELVAYEVGYRNKAIKDFSFDIAGFYNDYDDLSTQEFDQLYQIYYDNNGEGYTYGYEASANWQVQSNWKLSANYSYIDMDLHDEAGNDLGIEELTPDNIFNLRSLVNFGRKWEWDNVYYYWSSLKTSNGNIRNYNGFTTRIAYKPNNKQEISFVMRDVFDPTHEEDTSASTTNGTSEIERRYYVKFSQKF